MLANTTCMIIKFMIVSYPSLSAKSKVKSAVSQQLTADSTN